MYGEYFSFPSYSIIIFTKIRVIEFLIFRRKFSLNNKCQTTKTAST